MGKFSTFVLNRLSSSTFLKLYTLSCILNRQGPVYGMEILNRINKFEITWKPSHGTLYPLLEEMVNDGLIKFVYIADGKKYYDITEDGKIYYEDRYKEFKQDLVEASRFFRAMSDELYF